MADGKKFDFTRRPIQVTGKLELNRTDAESHLFRVVNAKVKGVE